MRILVIGGTRFLGPPVVERLRARDHEVVLFHRSRTGADRWPGIRRVTGDRKRIATHADALRDLRPDVVLDMIPMTEEDPRGVVEVFRGFARRVVAISSCDVYRAFGRVLGLEPGEPEPVPLDENAPLRRVHFLYRGRLPGAEDYEKILVERALRGVPELPSTILRLPMVYGPGDPQHRFFDFVKRCDDGRPAILLERREAAWRCTRAYVDDVADAIATATLSDHAEDRLFNVGDRDALTQAEWAGAVGEAADWTGEIVPLEADACPRHLRQDLRFEQDLVIDARSIRARLELPAPLDRGEALRRTVAWERSHPPERIDPARFDYAAEDAAYR